MHEEFATVLPAKMIHPLQIRLPIPDALAVTIAGTACPIDELEFNTVVSVRTALAACLIYISIPV